MAPAVKLHYFNLRGRGEYVRWILAYCNVDYDDIRHTFEEWPEVKKTMLTGMTPQLEYDGFTLAETDAIAHFLGKKYNIAGKNLEEETTCLMVANLINSYLTAVAKVRFEKDEQRQKTMREDLKEKTAPQFFGTVVKLLQKNDGKHIVGSSVTYADILLACLLDFTLLQAPEAAKKFPQVIMDFKNKMLEIPALKTWIAKRPVTDF